MRRLLKNTMPNPVRLPRFVDGSVMDFGIDQFPVKPENHNAAGFPRSDVSILLELERKVGVYDTRFQQVANRLSLITQKSSKKYSVKELFDMWRPASVQTPAEILAFEDYLNNRFTAVTTTEDVSSDAKDLNSVEKSVEAPQASE